MTKDDFLAASDAYDKAEEELDDATAKMVLEIEDALKELRVYPHPIYAISIRATGWYNDDMTLLNGVAVDLFHKDDGSLSYLMFLGRDIEDKIMNRLGDLGILRKRIQFCP